RVTVEVRAFRDDRYLVFATGRRVDRGGGRSGSGQLPQLVDLVDLGLDAGCRAVEADVELRAAGRRPQLQADGRQPGGQDREQQLLERRGCAAEGQAARLPGQR